MLEMIAKTRCKFARFALLAALVSLIAGCCLVGAVQNAYADTTDGADVLSSESIEADGDGSDEQGSSSAVDQDNGAESGDMIDTDLGESQTTPSDGNADQTDNVPGQDAEARPSEPAQSEPVKTMPEATPTKAGWLLDTDGTWYYFTDPQAQPLTGWVKSSGKWYWLLPDKNGAMAVSQWVEPGDGKRYYVKADGRIATGWFQVDGDWYYANKSGAVQQSGWVKSGGKWYWLLGDSQGKMAVGQWIENNGKRYYLTSKGPGQMATGWFQVDGDWYYANKSGAVQQSGWVKSGGKWYWLLGDSQGKMAVGQWIENNGKRYYLTSKGPGQMATGWFQVDGDWYYANKSGAQQMSGWLKSGGKWYWLQGDKQGRMLSNATSTIEGQHYSFASDGTMRANCQIDLGDGVARYAASSGAISRIGEYQDGKLVLTDASGQILTGWQKMAGKWFYGEEGTGIAQTGWLKLGKTWYYLDNSGAMVTGTRNIDGKTHLFTGSGKWLGSDAMAAKAQGYTSGTNWLILVDRGAHRVGIFNGSQGNWNRSQAFPCVTGAPASQTITGVFRTTGGKRMNLSTDSRARWCTQISGGYFFHTILASESELGQSLSHGCIRLAVPNTQWIYNNIGAGTTVVIYN